MISGSADHLDAWEQLAAERHAPIVSGDCPFDPRRTHVAGCERAGEPLPVTSPSGGSYGYCYADTCCDGVHWCVPAAEASGVESSATGATMAVIAIRSEFGMLPVGPGEPPCPCATHVRRLLDVGGGGIPA